MTETQNTSPEIRAEATRNQAMAEMQAAETEASTETEQTGMPKSLKYGIYAMAAVILLAILFTIIGIIIAFFDPGAADKIGAIRDIFIIVLAWFSILIALSIVILIMQVATLINLLKNEIIPILETFQRTANTVRGTTSFMSENLARPVIRATGFFAYIRTFFKYLGIIAGGELNEQTFAEQKPKSAKEPSRKEENAS